jgi:Rhodopirellula transposase DDE domain
MWIAPDVRDHVAASFFESMSEYLDEKILRLSTGALALALGEGSARAVAIAAGVSGRTVAAGLRDLADGSAPVERVRRAGAGRTRIETSQPGLWPTLDALVGPEERGDPENPLRWTVKSTRTPAGELGRQGFAASHVTVGHLLREHGYSLRSTSKVLEGKTVHGPDRDRQFRHINDTARGFFAESQPVISVDTKKKELIGNFDRPGSTWRPYQDPVEVADHTFATTSTVTAAPYGIYDIAADRGFVNVGLSHDTPAFATASIRRWWLETGHTHYPKATRLLIVADAGGSNACRSLLFKILLHQLALETGLEITVRHLPPGTSKWNKIEHRLFAQISSNWRGRPLISIDVVISSIAATTTRTGLGVQAVLDENDYPTGGRGNWDQLDALPITFDDFRGEWNYTIANTPPDPSHRTPRPRHARRPQHPVPGLIPDPAERATWIKALTAPEITGIPTKEWTAPAAHLEPAYRRLRLQRAIDSRAGRPARGNHREHALTVPFEHLMLATVLHERHRLPATQLSRLIELTNSNVNRHVTALAPLFTAHGHTITPTGTKTRKIEHFHLDIAPPHPDPATREITT